MDQATSKAGTSPPELSTEKSGSESPPNRLEPQVDKHPIENGKISLRERILQYYLPMLLPLAEDELTSAASLGHGSPYHCQQLESASFSQLRRTASMG